MRKPAFLICENKGADQLRSNCTADQRLCFRYINSTIPLLPNFKPLTIFFGCTARFVSDLVRNPEDWFSHIVAHIKADLSIGSLFGSALMPNRFICLCLKLMLNSFSCVLFDAST